MQLITAHQADRKIKLRFRGPALVQLSCKQDLRLLIGFEQLDPHRAVALDDFVLRICDDHSHRRLTAGQIRLLAEDMHHRRAQDLRDGFHPLQRLVLLIAVFKVIAHAMPHQVVQGQRLLQLDLLLPAPGSLGNIRAPFHAPHDFVFRVEDLHRQPPRAGMRGFVRNAHIQDAMRIRCAGRFVICRFRLEGFDHEHGRTNKHCDQEEKDKPEIGWIVALIRNLHHASP